jgi:hypothetical protein
MGKLVCRLEPENLEAVHLSDSVVRSRIVDIPLNILKHVIKESAASAFPFIMELDDTTYIPQYSQFLVFVHYVHAGAIKE